MDALPNQAVETAQETAGPIAGSGFDLWPSLLQMLFVLAMVIALIILLGWLFRRFAGNSFGLGPGGFLQVITSVSLGERRQMAVVRAGERYFLLGLTQNEVRLITELDKDAVQAGTPAPQPGQSPFARILKRTVDSGTEAGS